MLSEQKRNRNRISKRERYQWILAGTGLIVLACSYGVVVNGFNLYLKPVCDEYGFTRQSFSICSTIINLALMTVCLFADEIFPRFGLIKLMRFGSICLCIAYFMFGICSKLWMFYLSALLQGISVGFMSMVPYAIIINNWFDKNRGLALGICYMGSGIGGMVFNAVAGNMLATHDWSFVTKWTSATMLILIPLIFFFVKEKPETETESGNVMPQPINDEKEKIQYRQIAPFAIFAFCLGLVTCGISTSVVVRVSDLGYNIKYAASLSSICFGFMAAGKILLGHLYDRKGIRTGTYISLIFVVLGLFGLIFGKHQVFHLLIVMGTTLGSPIATVSYPIISREIYGYDRYLAVNGVINAASFLGVAFCPIIMNGLFDKYATYNPAYFIMIISTALALWMFNIAYKKRSC